MGYIIRQYKTKENYIEKHVITMIISIIISTMLSNNIQFVWMCQEWHHGTGWAAQASRDGAVQQLVTYMIHHQLVPQPKYQSSQHDIGGTHTDDYSSLSNEKS